MPIFSRATLQLVPSRSSPFLRGLIYFLLTALLATFAAEIVARSSLGNLLPAPSVEADSFLFDAKVYQLEQQVRREGGVDCLFIGSSVTNTGIDPAAVERAYREQTGKTIHCFNLGYPAMNVENAAAFAAAAIDKFQPRLIIYTFIPRDLTDVQYTVDFLEASPLFQIHPSTPHAWLIDCSYAFRYFLTWRYWLVNANRAKRLSEIEHLTPKGFQPAIGIRAPYPETINMSENYLAKVWSTPRPGQKLEQLLAMQNERTRFILVEGAIFNDTQSPALWQAYERDYILPLTQLLAGHNIPYWRSNAVAAAIPPVEWYDYFHLNQPGAQTFSEWIGHMLAEQRDLFQ